MTKPNVRAIRAAARLHDHAILITEAFEHMWNTLSLYDGFGERGESVSVTTGVGTSTTERLALGRSTAENHTASLNQQITAIETAIDDLINHSVTAKRYMIPKDAIEPEQADRMCVSHQHGKHKADVWGDPFCNNLGLTNRGGLCETHWKAWYRARKADNISTDHDFTTTRDVDGNEQPAWA